MTTVSNKPSLDLLEPFPVTVVLTLVSECTVIPWTFPELWQSFALDSPSLQ